MNRLVAATGNKGKLNEIKCILKDFDLEVVSMYNAGVKNAIKETGRTFKENALLKAETVFEITGEMVMADDSGLEVDYLNGAPGVYSARFAGEGATDEENNSKLLKLLHGVSFKKRSARFVCCIAVFLSSKEYFTVSGKCEGYIGLKPRGDKGFGYDPLFFMPEYEMSMAEIGMTHKNVISHRGKALKKMVKKLKKIYD